MQGDDSSRSLADSDFAVDGSTIRVAPLSNPNAATARAPAPERVHCLSVIEGEELGRQIVLAPGSIVIGRGAPADVVIADGRISRRHCELALSGQQVWVTDLRSTNGSYVHQRRISGRTVLPIGATLRLGGHLLRHEYRRRDQVEADLAAWSASSTSDSIIGAAVEIDPAARQLQVQKILSSDFFDRLSRELESLRTQ